jgi:TetR/AcrR family tetracycline transcriptional repressor
MTAKPTKRTQSDRAEIVEEALKLLNETSLSGLTMRVLADRVGLAAASLYWYFPNKAALISALSEHLFLKSLANTPPSPHWRDWMKGLGRSIWRVLLDYPDSAILIMSANIGADQFARNTACVREALARLDLPVEQLMPLQSGIQALMTGWSTFAHASYAEWLEEMLSLEAAAFSTLDAMVDGWDPAKVQQPSRP